MDNILGPFQSTVHNNTQGRQIQLFEILNSYWKGLLQELSKGLHYLKQTIMQLEDHFGRPKEIIASYVHELLNR